MEYISMAIAIAFVVFLCICWNQKRTLLEIYKGVFGRISSFIVFICFMAPFSLFINKLMNPEYYFSIWTVIFTIIRYWIPGFIVYYYSYKKCSENFRKKLLFAMIRCGGATFIQCACFIFVAVWYFVFVRPRYYVDDEGNIYEYIGW